MGLAMVRLNIAFGTLGVSCNETPHTQPLLGRIMSQM